MGDSPQPQIRLANHLKALRLARGLSLQALAARSGVSRASLSRIENAETSPTAETLGALASALAVPISQLLTPLERPFRAVVKAAEQDVWTDPQHGFLRRIVSPRAGDLRLEVLSCELAPRQTIAYSAPAVPGHEHHLVLLDGALAVDVGDDSHQLAPGDCLRYRLFGSSRFASGPEGARYLLALFEE